MNAPFYRSVNGALAAWSAKCRPPAVPFVCTTLERDDDVADVTIEFDIESFRDGEFELSLTDAYLDAPEPGDVLTAADRVRLAEWLMGDGYDRACEAATDLMHNWG